MKKILAGTSALIAAGLVAGAAHAADPITLSIGGYAHESIGVAGQVGAVRDTLNNRTDIQHKADYRLIGTGSTTLDNGLTVSVHTSFHTGGRLNGANLLNNDSFITVGGGFGQVMVGRQTTTAVGMIHRGAPHVTGGATFGADASNVRGGNWIQRPAGHAGDIVWSHASTGWGRDMVSYVSPSFSGFQVGGTYIPDTSAAGTHNRALKTTAGDGYGVGARYSGTFNDVSVSVNAGHVWANPRRNAGVGVGQARDWNVGAQVGFAGFTVGGSYRDLNPNAAVQNDRERTWTGGVAYATGPYAVSLNYFDNRTQAGVGVADKSRIWQLASAYTMGPGVALQGQLAHVTYDGTRNAVRNPVGGAVNYNQGWVAMTGIALSF